MRLLENIGSIDFDKMNGLVPAVIQDVVSGNVLMVGFMDSEAVKITVETKKVTFFSRTKNRLWTKGEESGNFLMVKYILIDCDADTLLVKAHPVGPVCHLDNETCFDENHSGLHFLGYLQDFIIKRKAEMPAGSYTTALFKEGTPKIAQKLGEEAVETIIGAMKGDDDNFIYETGDLLYHLLVLLAQMGYTLADVVNELKKRHKQIP